MDSERIPIILDNIELAIATCLHDIQISWIKNLIQNSRKNRGGSLTVYKDMVKSLEDISSNKFFELSPDQKDPYSSGAAKIMTIIKVMLQE